VRGPHKSAYLHGRTRWLWVRHDALVHFVHLVEVFHIRKENIHRDDVLHLKACGLHNFLDGLQRCARLAGDTACGQLAVCGSPFLSRYVEGVARYDTVAEWQFTFRSG